MKDKRPPDEILERLRYNPNTGVISSTVDRVRVTYRSAGKYQAVCISGEIYRAHRLPFHILGIDIEGLEIHHKNLIEVDNRFDNLQPLTRIEHKKAHRKIWAQRGYAYSKNIQYHGK